MSGFCKKKLGRSAAYFSAQHALFPCGFYSSLWVESDFFEKSERLIRTAVSSRVRNCAGAIRRPKVSWRKTRNHCCASHMGQNLQFHPHVHMIVIGGGLTPDSKWRESRQDFFLPVHVLSAKFRGRKSNFPLARLCPWRREEANDAWRGRMHSPVPPVYPALRVPQNQVLRSFRL